MRILSHRGEWTANAEQNTETAFRRSFTSGFGTETDVRDHEGALVISHDVPSGDELSAHEFFKIASEFAELPLALNIKADGLIDLLLDLLDEELLARSFVFDMAVPDMRSYLDSDIRVFTRASDVERAPVWIDQCKGVWLDSFGPEWFGGGEVERYLDRGLEVCVVSPELHGRQASGTWELLRPYAENDLLSLCTDRPQEALEFLGIE